MRAMVVNTAPCYDVLSKILDRTVEIVPKWLEENRQAVDEEPGFLHFLAMTMKAKNCKDWFKPNDKGEYNTSKIAICEETNIYRAQKVDVGILQRREAPNGGVHAQYARYP